MRPHEPRDADWDGKVHRGFGAQRFMATLGARIVQLAPGACTVELPWNDALVQQNGFLHAGASASIADSAAGYAAFTLMAAGVEVLTTEFKMHLLAPARGRAFQARARVERAGRTLTVVACDVFAIAANAEETRVALFVGTMMAVDLPAPAG